MSEEQPFFDEETEQNLPALFERDYQLARRQGGEQWSFASKIQ